MSFREFGKVNFVSETRVADFVRFLKEGKVMATRCSRCGTLYFPPRADCPEDLSAEMKWEELTGKCKLLTYTTVHFAPEGFQPPYTIVLAECDEGVNVYGLLSKTLSEETISVGMRLQVTPLRLADGRVTYELRKSQPPEEGSVDERS